MYLAVYWYFLIRVYLLLDDTVPCDWMTWNESEARP